jgi:hypothetical protein
MGMKTLIKYILPVCTLFLIAQLARGQIVSLDEATKIARNWINVIIDERGSWGNHSDAEILPLQELMRNERKLGYVCNVNPEGYIVLSLRRELAPVKAYSTKGSFDLTTDHTGEDIIKTSMAYILDTIESRLGPVDHVKPGDLAPLLEINYTGAWEAVYAYTKGTWPKKVPKENGEGNYQEGDTLLGSNNWHQYPPYNEQCPFMGCTTTSNGNAFVGCVATAGCQIMYYWSWPPEGTFPYWDPYDWPNMHDEVTTSSPQPEIDAVAELCHEVGVAVGMDYGCDGSGAVMNNMLGVFGTYYRYSTNCSPYIRQYYGAIDWFESIKAQLNANRPMEYGITDHAIVCDGWQETGSPVIREYHMNWGWVGTNDDTWYTLDALPGGGIFIESYIGNIYPAPVVGSTISGTYNVPSYPYRYFNLDASGSNATFNSGHYLQFLPEVTVTGTGTTTPIRFNGSTTANTSLFTGGDVTKGIRISDGSILLTHDGSIKLYKK